MSSGESVQELIMFVDDLARVLLIFGDLGLPQPESLFRLLVIHNRQCFASKCLGMFSS